MKIGELARATGMKTETIRFYEKEGLLPPPARTEANYRQYQPAHAHRLFFIRRSRELGFTLAQVRQLLLLADDGADPALQSEHLIAEHLAEIDGRLRDLSTLRAALVRFGNHELAENQELLNTFPSSEG